jgi:hypothetical protein
LFVDANGNVGIANSSPTNARLLVGDDLGAITTAARMVQVGHPSGGMLILGKDNTDYSYLTHEASTQTSNWFYRGGAGITLNSAGLVGVGTSSPSYKLHVVTDAISGRQDPTNISRTSGNLIRFTNPQFSTDASMGLLLRVFPDADSRQGAGIIANGGTNNGSTTLDLFYTDTAGTSKSGLRISDTGAVGIGTTAPSYALHVSGTGEVSSRTFATDATGAASFFVQNDGNAICGPLVYGSTKTAYGALASNETAFYSNRSTTIMADGGSTVIKFATGGNTERARIDSSGRLLVGTTSSTGSLSNTAPVIAGLFQSFDDVATFTTGVAQTLFVIPNTNATYIVTLRRGSVGDAANYEAVSILSTNSGGSVSAVLTDLKTAANVLISISGTNLQGTQSSGGNASLRWVVTRVG